MTVETISGNCPCCGFDKMIQRYGSTGWLGLDACASCGFGYVDNPGEPDEKWDNHLQLWHDESFGHLLLHMYGFGYKGDTLPTEYPTRKEVFIELLNAERHDDVKGTVYNYNEDFINAHVVAMDKPFNMMGLSELGLYVDKRPPGLPLSMISEINTSDSVPF
jgi:hypothetical protein